MKRIKSALLLQAIFLLCCLSSYAQRTCGSQSSYTVRKEISKAADGQEKKGILPAPSAAKGGLPIVTIPVVIHILYKKDKENISDAQVISQIEALNRDFRMLNTDIINVPAVFMPVAADCQIEFCLAKRTPSGNTTSGITRTKTPYDDFTEEANTSNADNYYQKAFFTATGGIDAWDPTKYLNIYVGNLDIYGVSNIPQPLSFINTAGTPTDCIFVKYSAFGTIPTPALEENWNEGGITTHEVGHYLNLLHTFGENGEGCNYNDLIYDTPTQAYATTSCPMGVPNTCIDTLNDLPDMYMNFMDYTPDSCIYMFTELQKQRMAHLFIPNGARYSLITSDGCVPSVNCTGPVGMNADLITPTSAVLHWDPGFYPENCKITVSHGAVTDYDVIVNSPDYSLSISNLLPGTSYAFKVKSKCPDGNYSGFSNGSFQTPLCAAPSGLSIALLTPSTVTLNWMAQPFASSYNVELFYGNAWHPAGIPLTNALAVTGLSDGTIYQFRVSSGCDMAWSATSAAFQFTTPVCAAPSGLTVANITPTGALLKWTAVSYASLYKAEVLYDGIWHDKGTSATNSLAVSGMPDGKNCSFRVSSSCGTENSATSSAFAFKTLSYCNSDVYEPNDSKATAHIIPASSFSPTSASTSVSVIGILCHNDMVAGGNGGDEDWFSFSNSNGHGYVSPLAGYPDVRVTTGSLPADYKIKLYNWANVEIGTPNDGKTIIYHPCFGATGTYYVKAYSSSGSFSLSQMYLITVTLTAISYPCYSFRETAIDPGQDIKEAGIGNNITVFPNPAAANVTIAFSPALAKEIQELTIVNLLGQKILKIDPANQNIVLDISGISNGTYIIVLKTKKETITQKLLIQH